MNPWFSPEIGPYFSLLSLMSLMALMSYWVRQGRHRKIVFGSFYASIALGVAFLIAAAIAWFVDQPSYVVSSLAWTGAVITAVFIGTIGVIRKGYAESEQRRILARDI